MLLEKGSIGQNQAVSNNFQKGDTQLQTPESLKKKKKWGVGAYFDIMVFWYRMG